MKSAVSFVVIFLLSGLTSLIQPNPAAQTLDSKNSFFSFHIFVVTSLDLYVVVLNSYPFSHIQISTVQLNNHLLKVHQEVL